MRDKGIYTHVNVLVLNVINAYTYVINVYMSVDSDYRRVSVIVRSSDDVVSHVDAIVSHVNVVASSCNVIVTPDNAIDAVSKDLGVPRNAIAAADDDAAYSPNSLRSNRSFAAAHSFAASSRNCRTSPRRLFIRHYESLHERALTAHRSSKDCLLRFVVLK
jgi:hypothetical protein